MTAKSELERFAARTHLALASIVVVYLASRALLIATAVSPARDGARYLSYARELERHSLREVAPAQKDHPGYPLAIYAALRVGDACDFTSPTARVRLAQTSTAAAGLLLVVAAYFLARRVWCPLVAWAGMMAFVLLPRPAWQTADILSDPLYAAFFLMGSLLFAKGIEARREPEPSARGRSLPLLASGICCALAYWVRVDAVMLLPAVFGTLAAQALESRWKEVRSSAPTSPPSPSSPLSSILKGAMAFAGGFVLGLVPFIALCGRLSGKPIIDFLIGDGLLVREGNLLVANAHPGIMETAGEILGSLGAVLSSAGKEAQYLHAVLAAPGAVLALRVGARRAAGLFLVVLFLVSALAFWFVQYRAGYLSARYFLAVSPLVTCLSFYFILHGGCLLRERTVASTLRILTKPALLVALGLGLSLAVSLPSLFGRRLHDDYHGAISAARWVAEQVKEGDTVYEPNFFPAYFAGLEERKTPAMIPTTRSAADHYVILRERTVETADALQRLIEAGRAVKVRDFPRKPGGEKRDVHVYLIRGQRA